MARSQTKNQDKPPQTTSVPYRRTPDFKSVVVDGALLTVRPHTQTAIFTLFEDDIVTHERVGKLKSVEGGAATYELGEIVQENIHSVHTTLRMSFEEAISLADLIKRQVGLVRPDLIKEENVDEVTQPNPAKAKKRPQKRQSGK